MAKYNNNKDDISLKNLVVLLFDVSCISSGFQVDNVSVFSKKFYNIVSLGLGLDEDEEPSSNLESLSEKVEDLVKEKNNEDLENSKMEEVD